MTTMNCKDVESLLPYLLTDELDEDTRIEVDLHTRYCPHCSALHKDQLLLRQAVQVLKTSTPAMPASLPASIRMGLDRVDAARRPSVWGLPAFRVGLSAAFTVAVALAGFLFYHTGLPTDALTPLLTDAVSRHAHLMPLEVKSGDPNTVRSWFDGKVDFALPAIPVSMQQAPIMGARLSNVRDRQAAQMEFKAPDGNRYTLFVFTPPGGFTTAALPVLNVQGRTFYQLQQKGFNTLVWQQQGLLYTLVGQSPVEHMVKLVSQPQP